MEVPGEIHGGGTDDLGKLGPDLLFVCLDDFGGPWIARSRRTGGNQFESVLFGGAHDLPAGSVISDVEHTEIDPIRSRLDNNRPGLIDRFRNSGVAVTANDDIYPAHVPCQLPIGIQSEVGEHDNQGCSSGPQVFDEAGRDLLRGADREALEITRLGRVLGLRRGKTDYPDRDILPLDEDRRFYAVEVLPVGIRDVGGESGKMRG